MISLLLADGRLNVSSISGLERALRFVNWFSNNQAPTTKSTVSCASSASFKRCFWDEYPKIATAAETNRSEGDSKSRTNDSPKFAEASSSSLKPKKSCEEKKKLRRKERKRRRRENGFGRIAQLPGREKRRRAKPFQNRRASRRRCKRHRFS
ncbi:hypothetical protein L596_009008 [Steinernema carpocapsae]|uniref:Uncharacterized protein n=1 Tax=Steinernema carpocapsae TaxID=34508 RepID=A0A4U5PE42_STECR|nr:hypothetical protein L596_009008 [Steinernema carpocapsae]